MAVNTPMAFRRGTVGQFLPGMQAKLEPVAGIARGGMLRERPQPDERLSQVRPPG